MLPLLPLLLQSSSTWALPRLLICWEILSLTWTSMALWMQPQLAQLAQLATVVLWMQPQLVQLATVVL
jgi:hypothetical protein